MEHNVRHNNSINTTLHKIRLTSISLVILSILGGFPICQPQISPDHGFNFLLMLSSFQSKTVLFPIQEEQIKHSPVLHICIYLFVADTTTNERLVYFLWCKMQMFFMLHSHTASPVFERRGRWDFLPAYILSVSHQRGVCGSAGLHWDLDLSSVYRASISLVPLLPLIVRLMTCWVKPEGWAAPGTIQSRNRGDSSFSPCLKMKKQKALI